MPSFGLLFGRKPRTSLDSLVPLSEETGLSAGLVMVCESESSTHRDHSRRKLQHRALDP